MMQLILQQKAKAFLFHVPSFLPSFSLPIQASAALSFFLGKSITELLAFRKKAACSKKGFTNLENWSLYLKGLGGGSTALKLIPYSKDKMWHPFLSVSLSPSLSLPLYFTVELTAS